MFTSPRLGKYLYHCKPPLRSIIELWCKEFGRVAQNKGDDFEREVKETQFHLASP